MADEKKKSRAWFFVVGFAAAVAAFAVTNPIKERVTSSEFCGTTCHEMEGVYRAWKTSPLYANKMGSVTHCVDCHLPPPNEYFARTAREVYEGSRNIYNHFWGPAYDPNAMEKRVLSMMGDDRCIRCHQTLLVKPNTIGSRIAHENPEKLRCVECHKLMHGRAAVEKQK
jgi:nitrate/TMAO reductase-like tetraheme cytochrome c subunit